MTTKSAKTNLFAVISVRTCVTLHRNLLQIQIQNICKCLYTQLHTNGISVYKASSKSRMVCATGAKQQCTRLNVCLEPGRGKIKLMMFFRMKNCRDKMMCTLLNQRFTEGKFQRDILRKPCPITAHLFLRSGCWTLCSEFIIGRQEAQCAAGSSWLLSPHFSQPGPF